jgi:hypothetical protein
VSESDLYGALMIEATRLGHRLYRNNVGRARYRSPSGSTFAVPYGLCVGASDLIGWTLQRRFARDQLTVITELPSIAIFTAIECKSPKKKPTKEQQAFLAAVRNAGGIAGVVESIADYHKLIGHVEP